MNEKKTKGFHIQIPRMPFGTQRQTGQLRHVVEPGVESHTKKKEYIIVIRGGGHVTYLSPENLNSE